MSLILAKFRRHQLDAQTARAVDDAVKHDKPVAIEPGSPAGRRLLRGVPVAGAASGTSPGTDPLHELLEKERKR